MVCRKANAVFNRILALIAIIAVAALSWSALFFVSEKSAHADETDTHDEVFGANHASATALSTAVSELPSGSYYLTNDIVLTNMIELFQNEDVSICLHGHSITISGNHIFKIYSGTSLGIYDCGDAEHCGTVRGGKGIYVSGGTLNLYGGAIKEGYGGYGIGCGVTVSGNGVFNMYGGAVTDNKAAGNGGGGVCVGYNGTFNMYGGEIRNNSADKKDGAGVLVGDATAVFHMYGGSITNNTINFSAGDTDDTINFYGGAGVCVNGGTFTVEGAVNISGNTTGKAGAKKINNLKLLRNSNYEGKIEVTGKLAAGSKIGVTMPAGVLTNGYAKKGNTADPSEVFVCDDGLTVGYDGTRKEAEIKSGADVGGYNMESATVTGASAATVGDTSVTLTVEVTLKNAVTSAVKKITDAVTVDLSTPLHGGNNTVSFKYEYNGESGTQTEQLSYVVTPAKKHVYVTWSCSGATMQGNNAAKRDYDGDSILGSIAASYTGYDGQTKRIEGNSADMIAKDEGGNTVNSTAGVGVYNIYLAPSADYEFDNNMFTLTVNAVSTDNGYYIMKSATAKGVFGTPVVGDKKVTVTVQRTLDHTGDLPDKTETVNTEVTLLTALHVGANTVSFDYDYTDAKGGVQTERLTLTVNAVQKQVTVKWYFDGMLAANNEVKLVYNGADASGKIVAEYDGYDGTKQSVDGTSAGMIKKDKDGNTVTALSAVGEYTLSLAASADYVFKNNSFGITVAGNLGEISDLTYEEDDEVILGVSCDDGFESGTEVVVEKVDNIGSGIVAGTVNSALNISFVNNSVEVTPTGTITVRVLIPNELNGKEYKIYSLNNGVATEVRFTTGGGYATFEAEELNTILFVTQQTPNPIPTPTPTPTPDGNNGTGIVLDDSGLVWVWVCVAVIAASFAIMAIVIVVLSKRRKK